jgi:hypothetical protein
MTSAAGDAGLLDGDEVAEGSLLALAVGSAVGVGEAVEVGFGVGGGGGGGGGGVGFGVGWGVGWGVGASTVTVLGLTLANVADVAPAPLPALASNE